MVNGELSKIEVKASGLLTKKIFTNTMSASMNRYRIHEPTQRTPSRPIHSEVGVTTVNTLEEMVSLGREFVEDGYKDIFASDSIGDISIGYLFVDKKRELEMVIRIKAKDLRTSPLYLDERFNNERGRNDFMAVFKPR